MGKDEREPSQKGEVVDMSSWLQEKVEEQGGKILPGTGELTLEETLTEGFSGPGGHEFLNGLYKKFGIADHPDLPSNQGKKEGKPKGKKPQPPERA